MTYAFNRLEHSHVDEPREFVVIVGSSGGGSIVRGMFTREEAEDYAAEKRETGFSATVRGVLKP